MHQLIDLCHLKTQMIPTVMMALTDMTNRTFTNSRRYRRIYIQINLVAQVSFAEDETDYGIS